MTQERRLIHIQALGFNIEPFAGLWYIVAKNDTTMPKQGFKSFERALDKAYESLASETNYDMF